ncbi:hypothetical protein Tco_0163159 [Tanacetum coccineum]
MWYQSLGALDLGSQVEFHRGSSCKNLFVLSSSNRGRLLGFTDLMRQKNKRMKPEGLIQHYGILEDLKSNRSSGISSLVGAFVLKVIKCGVGSSLSTSSASREGDRGDPDFRSLFYGGSTERLAVYYTKFSELLKLSREYQMLTVTKVTGPMRPVTGNLLVPGKLRSLCKNPRLKKKTPESAQGKIRKQENCTNLPPVTLSGLRRRRKKVWVQFLMKRSYSHSMDMLAFGMKMDEQALEPGTDEIRGKHGTGHYTGGARHDRDLRFKYR